MKRTYLYQTKHIFLLNKFILIAYISLSDEKSDDLFHAAVVGQ